MLMEDTARTCAQYLSTSRGEDSLEHRAKIYHSLVLWGKLQSAVCCITEREKRGVIQPEDTFTKKGQPVLEVLRSNHPKAFLPTAQSLEADGGKPLEMVPVDITDVTVVTVLRQLLGSENSGGVGSISLQHWLLQFGMESLVLRQIVWEFRDWMAKGRPPWAAYRALISGRLISLNK